ncbi:MAG TPA: WD40 repeat domain-containing protein [Gemmataceae bacterium]|nr:WD40 repeat domain-containing protein [Gemmataceae bacterium]
MTIANRKAVWIFIVVLAMFAGAGIRVYHGQASEPPKAAKDGNALHSPRDAFGDSLPSEAIARLGTVRLRHADYLRAIRFFPDGKTVVSLGGDEMRVWDAATGRQLRHFGAGLSPWSVAMSADGQRVAFDRNLAVSGKGGPVEVWDAAAGKLLHKLGSQHYSLLCFSPDGKRLAAFTGIDNPVSAAVDHPWRIDVWDVATGRSAAKLIGPSECVMDMRFSADGKTLLLGGSGKAISLCDVASGKETRRLRDLPADVHTLVVSPRGDRAAFIDLQVKRRNGGGNWAPGRHVILMDLRSGVEVRRWSVPAEVGAAGLFANGWWHLAFSPDGRKLAACQKDGPVRVWDTATGKEIRILSDGRIHAGGMTFSPDGRTLAVGDFGQVLRLIDAESGADRVTTKGHRGGVTALAVSAAGRTVFTAVEDGTIHRWDARTGRELGRLTGHKQEVTGLTLSADGRTLCSVSLDQSLRVWDLDAGKERRRLEAGNVSAARLSLSPDGKTLAVPSNSKELLLFNPTTGERLHRLATKTRIITVAFAADASVVMALTGDHTICRWEMPTGRRLSDLSLPLDGDEPPIDDPDNRFPEGIFVLSPVGRLVAHALNDRFLRVFDVGARREVYRTVKLPSNVSMIAFAPDGRTLVWAERSGIIHWLELTSGSERLRLPGHAGPVKHMVFTTDGKQLVSGSDDATGLVWDLLGQGATTLSAEQRDACWTDLADKDAARAYRAMCRLMAAPADALILLRPRLKAIEGVDEKRIAQRIAALDSDTFAVREKATEELQKLGELAEPALRKALASRPTLEMSRRVRGLLDEIGQRQWRPSAEILRQLRAVEVLERIGTPEARALLEALAHGAAGARLTREARAAAQRLGG